MSEGSRTIAQILMQDGRFVYNTVGVSMRPLLRARRDVVVIEKRTAERCKKLDAVLFVRKNGQYVLHRILKVYDGGYWIVGDNCYNGENVVENQILGIMTSFKRGKHMISVSDWRYKLYVHIWCDIYPIRFALLKTKRFVFRILRIIKRKIFR